jgi:transposase
MEHKQQEKTKKATCRPTQGNWQQMNRKQRGEMTRKIQSEDIRLEVIHPDAAGIDIGNESHYVAVPPTRDSQPVQRFGCILSEVGWDMSKWEAEDHFVSWLRLCPDNRISGDEIIGKGRLPTNRVSIASMMAASSLRLSNTYLGAQFHRLRLDTPVAIKAIAAKLARLVYRILRYGMKYVDRGAAFYEAQHRPLQIKHLKSKAAKLGFQILQVPAA